MYYTGVGSRSTPQDVLHLMTRIAMKMRDSGYILRSGGAEGADTAFEQGAGIDKEIYYANDATPEAEAIAAQFHPAWHKCKPYVRKLHGRNAFQILGRHLQEPSIYCICWTPDGCTTHMERCYRTGGTGTAISIAEAYQLYIVNLAIPSHRKTWEEWVNN